MKHRSFTDKLILVGAMFAAFQLPNYTQAGMIGNYLKSRGSDLMDIAGLRFSLARKAQSAGVLVEATSLARVGAVYFDGGHAGMDRRALGVWREKRTQAALGPFAFCDVEMKTLHGNTAAYDAPTREENDTRGVVRNDRYEGLNDGREHPDAIGIEIQPGILPGVEARVHPFEAIDFVLGIIGLDIYHDDYHDTEINWQAEPLPESEAPAIEEGAPVDSLAPPEPQAIETPDVELPKTE